MTTSQKHRFLLIGYKPDEQWPLLLQEALTPLGKLRIIQENEVMRIVSHTNYDLIIIDAGVVSEITLLLSRLRASRPKCRVLVVTASPSWQAAREALKAGAIDYVNRSFDINDLRSKIRTALGLA
jgi:DNA-binding response OmpR family regulator